MPTSLFQHTKMEAVGGGLNEAVLLRTSHSVCESKWQITPANKIKSRH